MNRQEIERMNDLDKMIQQLERKRKELRERRMSITASISDMPKSHSEADRMAEYVAALDEIDREYAEIIEEHERLYVRYARAISSLRHLERQIIKFRYESRMPWRKIARIVHYSEQWVQELHKEALKKIEQY